MKSRSCYKLDESTMEDIVMLRGKGLSCEKVGELIKIGASTVSKVDKVYKAANMGDNEYLMKYNGTRNNTVKWACKKFGIVLPATEAPATPPPAAARNQESIDQANTALAFAALLEAVHELTESVNRIYEMLK